MNSASTVLRGVSANRRMVEILWPRRETRRQTEKTNLDLYLRKKLIYSTIPLGCIICAIPLACFNAQDSHHIFIVPARLSHAP